MNFGRPVLTQADIDNHVSRQPGNNDIIWDPLYDFASYAAAGQAQISFFTQPQGQGTTSAPGGAGVKTIHDTNLTQQGQLGLGQRFFCTGIEILFFPGQVNPSRAAIVEATYITSSFVNDVYTVFRSGLLTFSIGSNRVYSQQAPLGLFPATTRVYMSPALTGQGATATSFAIIDYAAPAGEPYSIVGQFIESTQVFNVTVSWPGLVPLPTGVAGRIGCRLRGYQIRNVQ